MVTEKIVVGNISKKYSNPISEMIQAACKYPCSIRLINGTKRLNAKSIMGVMALNLSEGMELEVEADGENEAGAAKALADFLTCV